jgi:hypothetical protein
MLSIYGTRIGSKGILNDIEDTIYIFFVYMLCISTKTFLKKT